MMELIKKSAPLGSLEVELPCYFETDMRVQREVTLPITIPSYNKYLPTTPHISFVIFALSVIKLMFEYIISQIQLCYEEN